MSKMIKRLMVVLLSALMFVGVVTTPVQAKGGKGGKSQPTPEPVVEPEPETSEDPEQEASEKEPAEETVSEEEIIETEENEESAAETEGISEEIESVIDEVFALNTTSDTTETVIPTRAVTDAPATSKTLISNGDGTYTLALSVTGATSSSSTTTVTKSNVILVLDTSNSMSNSNTTYNSQSMSRMNAMKQVLCDTEGIIDKLLANNTTANPDIIEIAVVDFGTRGVQQQDFTYNASTLKSTIRALTTSTGTNWEEGLQKAKTYADSIKALQPDEDVYIIFMTDGEPTTHANSYNPSNNTTGYQTNWGYASDDARALVTAGYKFYGIFTWGSSTSSKYLSSLVQYAYTGSGTYNSDLDSAYAEYFTDATSTEALLATLESIAQSITTGV